MPDFDAIVYGTVCVDLMWRVDRLSAPGSYEPIQEERRTIGGEASNTAIALSRWGLRVALVGTATGDDENGRHLRGMFARDAPEIDISKVGIWPGASTAYCVCIATPDGHRTMYGSGFTGMQCPDLDPEFVRRASVFTLDPNAYESGLKACGIASAAGVPIVAMDYTLSSEVNSTAEISVTSHAQIAVSGSVRAYGEYAAAIRDRHGCTTVVTCGESGCFVAEHGIEGKPAVHVPAFTVDRAIDTTGAGDIFRAGLIYGRHRGWDIVYAARYGSAAAALNCTELGGWAGVRPAGEVEAFLRSAKPLPVRFD